jgi:hypothetical protein
MLRTLRLRFADRPDHDLAFEATEDDADADAWRLLKSRVDRHGRISLGDRDSCGIEDVLEVTLVDIERIEGTTFEHGLQDEDVAAALDENYDPPPRTKKSDDA